MVSADEDPPVDRPNLSEGLSGGHGTGGLDSSPVTRVLFRQQDRSPTQGTRRLDRRQGKARAARDRSDARL
jgi:hypothetical protein